VGTPTEWQVAHGPRGLTAPEFRQLVILPAGPVDEDALRRAQLLADGGVQLQHCWQVHHRVAGASVGETETDAGLR
jgi:hypothetical protein